MANKIKVCVFRDSADKKESRRRRAIVKYTLHRYLFYDFVVFTGACVDNGRVVCVYFFDPSENAEFRLKFKIGNSSFAIGRRELFTGEFTESEYKITDRKFLK